jgi:hypothetical protein
MMAREAWCSAGVSARKGAQPSALANDVMTHGLHACLQNSSERLEESWLAGDGTFVRHKPASPRSSQRRDGERRSCAPLEQKMRVAAAPAEVKGRAGWLPCGLR